MNIPAILVTLHGVLLVAAPICAQANNPRENQPPVEATSLLGKPLARMTFEGARLEQLNRELVDAQRQFERDPTDVDNIIWYGRRTAYLWHYNRAIQIYSDGIRLHPGEPRLYRHRGHRYITLRKFALAESDLTKAAALIAGKPDTVEADGQPNAAGIPTSTLHTNIWYHLGLAHYLQGEYPAALSAYEKCLAAAKNNDMKVATLDWIYLTLCRLGRGEEARHLIRDITPDLKVIENHAYHNRILMYRGLKQPSDLIPESGADAELDVATYGYGVGNWYLNNGDHEKAERIFRQVIGGKYWVAFGYIASEAELARRQPRN